MIIIRDIPESKTPCNSECHNYQDGYCFAYNKECYKKGFYEGRQSILSKGIEVDIKLVTLCGSSKFCDMMAVCAWLIEKEEHAITMGLHLLPQWYCRDKIPDHLAEHENVSQKMNELHRRKIDISNEIFVVNYEHYIGLDTKGEIEYAQSKNIPIRWFTNDYIGEKVNKILENFLFSEVRNDLLHGDIKQSSYKDM